MKNFKTAEDLVNIFTQNFENLMQFKEKICINNTLSIFEAWEKIVGDINLAANCELSDINRSTAIIIVRHSGWSQQILMRKKTILKNFKKLYPELNVENISVIVQSEFIEAKPMQAKIAYKPTQEEIEYIKAFEKKQNKKSFPPELETALNSLKKAILKKQALGVANLSERE